MNTQYLAFSIISNKTQVVPVTLIKFGKKGSIYLLQN